MTRRTLIMHSAIASCLLLILLSVASPSAATSRWQQDGALVSTIATSKLYPSITGDKYGGAFVVWEDYRDPLVGDIYLQKVDINGTPVFASDKDVTIDNASDKRFPAIVKDGSGGAYVVWEDDRSGSTDIYIQKINASGEPVWTEDKIVCNEQGNQWSPRIALTNSGDAIIVWEDHRGTVSQVYAQMIGSDGNPKTVWPANGIAVATSNANQSYPAISSDGSNGAVIVWEDWRSPSIDIYGQLIDSTGVKQWGSSGAVITNNSEDQWYPSIATDGNNNFVVTWEDYRDDSGFYSNIYANVIDLSGSPLFVPDKAVTIADDDQRLPRVAYSANEGSFIIVWEDFRNYPESYTNIYARKITSAGEFPFADAEVSTAFDSQEAPSITSSDTAGVIAVWQDSRVNPAYDIYALSLPIPGSLTINNDAISTATTDVTLNLWASNIGGNVTHMCISNDNADCSTWETYSTTRAWTLAAGGGTKRVYTKFKDSAGNISASYFDDIIFSLPTGTVSINSGAEYTNSRSVSLAISAANAAQMCISNTTSCSSWETYATSNAWTLTSGDGTKIVYVQFKDQYGNLSSVSSDDIILDMTLPSGTVAITSPITATYTNSRSVTLTVSATDAGSGPCVMVFSNDNINWGSWSECNYATSTSWTLSGGDGEKTVYARFRDKIGNWSSSPSSFASNTVILDTTPPTGSISINGGAQYATSSTVNLTLSASDTRSGISLMRFSNDNTNWSAWEAYGTAKSWPLSTGDGTKTVYVQFKDVAGNVEAYSANITLDSTGPSGTLVINSGAAYTNNTDVTLTLTAIDAISNASQVQMRFSTDNSSWSGWESYADTKSYTVPSGDGTKTVYVQFKDGLENISTYSDNITLDKTPPTGSFLINGGAAYTTSASVTLNFSASDSIGVTWYYISTSSTIPSASDSGWTSITSTPNYSANVSYQLSNGDGTKTLYVWYKDAVGNVSTTYSKSITLDTTAPTDGTLSATTSGSQVSLNWSGFSDSTSGIGSYKLVYSTSGTPASCSSGTQVYSGSGTSYTHTGLADNTYFYRVCAVDNAGNTSSGTTANATTDTTAATGSISINNGAAYTTSESVTLNLSASDSDGVTGHYLSTTSTTPLASDFGWTSITSTTSYIANLSYTLIGSDGTKTVYVWYKDAAGNVSITYSKSITLDTTAPTDGTLSATTSGSQVSLNWSGFSDSASGIGSYKLVYSTSGTPASCSSGTQVYSGIGTSYTHTGLADNTYYYRVCAVDNAGNTSSGTTTSATTDTTAAIGSIAINNGAAYTTSESVTLNLAASDSVGVTGYYISTSSTIPSASAPGWTSITSTTSYIVDLSYALSGSDGTKTVYVWYKDAAGNVSQSYSDDIMRDNTMPTGSISINSGAIYTNSTSITLTISCTDSGSGCSQMQFSNDNSIWSTPEAYVTAKTWDLSATDGIKTVYVKYKDNAGNWSTTEIKDTIYLDTTPPSAISTIPATGATGISADSSIIVTFSEMIVNAPSSILLKQGDSIIDSTVTYNDATKTATLTPTNPLSEYTTYTVIVTTSVRDIAANPMAAPYSFSFTTTDGTKPTSTILSPIGGAIIGNASTYTISGTAYDAGSGVSKVEVSINNGTWQEATGTTSWTYSWLLPTDGIYTIKTKATDSAGNIGDEGTGTTLTVDNTKPTTVASPSGGTYDTSKNLTLSTNETATVFYTTDGTTPTINSQTYTSPIAINKNTTLKFFAVDLAGNVEAAKTENYYLDVTPPITTVSPAGGLYKTSQTVTLTSSKAGVTYYSTEGSTPSITYTGQITIDSTTTLKFYSCDLASNCESVKAEIYTIDTTIPTGAVTINNGASFTNALNITITLTASTDATSMRFSQDGTSWKGWETYSESFSYRLPSGDGTKTVHVQFMDAAGNISLQPYSDDIILDTIPPAATISAGTPSNPTNLTSAVLTVSGTDVVYYKYNLDNGSYSTSETAIATQISLSNLSEGSHTVSVIGRDAAGNWQAETGATTVTWTVDTTPPGTGSGTTATVSIDGASTVSGQMTYSYSKIVASWTSLSDPTAGLKEYMIAVGTTPGGTDILNWTPTAVPSYTTGDISSDNFGKTLYISIKAVDLLGNESSILISSSFVYTPGDINSKGGIGDGRVDGFDLGFLGIAYNPFGAIPTGFEAADINRDGVVNFDDLSILAVNFGKAKP